MERMERLMFAEKQRMIDEFFDYQHQFFNTTSKWLKEFCYDYMGKIDYAYTHLLGLMFRGGYIKMKDYIAGYDALHNELSRCRNLL